MSKFLKGTMILLIAGFFTRVLGFINRIVIARFIGEEGVGLYMMVFPTLILVITITQLGLPVAISRNVAEAQAKGDVAKVKRILVVSLAITLSLSLLFTPALMLSAKYLSTTIFTDPRTFYPLFAITPIIPIVAVSSVLRGYFQGKQNMKPAAIAQVLEQIVRIGLIAILTKPFLPYGIEYAAAAAMVASVIGELFSFLYLLTSFKIKKHFRLRSGFLRQLQAGGKTFNSLIQVALPTLGGRMIGNISWFFEPIVVAHALAIAGVATTTATKQYGSLTGFALPLLMLPSFITHSLSTALVPAISEAHSKNDIHLIEYRLQQALRFVLLTGGIAVVVLFVLAEPLMEVMYGSANGSHFIKLMAPLFLFSYFQAPLQATLQALNLAHAAMMNSLIGAVFKLGVIFFLASQESFGINGAAVGILVGIVLVTLLHFATILKTIPFTIYLTDYLKTGIAMFLTGALGIWLLQTSYLTGPQIMEVFSISCIMIICYLFILLFTGLIKKTDLQRIPFFNHLFTYFFGR